MKNNNFLITFHYRGQNKTILGMINPNEKGDNVQIQTELMVYDNKLLPNMYDHAAWGITTHNGYIYLAEANAIRIINSEYHEFKRHQDTNEFRHLHDIANIEDKIYVANTGHDRVEIYSYELEYISSINIKELRILNKMRVISKTNPTLISDCFHVNQISTYSNDIFLTLSFINKNRILTTNYPFIKRRAVQSPGLVYNLTKKKIFIKSIMGAHDGVWFKDSFWVNETYTMTLKKYNASGKVTNYKAFKDAGIYRGLSVSETEIFIGVTKIDRSRTTTSNYERLMNQRGGEYKDYSRILMLDVNTLQEKKEYILEDYEGISPEIYEIIRYD